MLSEKSDMILDFLLIFNPNNTVLSIRVVMNTQKSSKTVQDKEHFHVVILF